MTHCSIKSGTYARIRKQQSITAKPAKESDTEAIIASLKTLQLKLKQLEDERNATSKLINELCRGGELLWKNEGRGDSVEQRQYELSEVEVKNIICHCENIETQLLKILSAKRETAEDLPDKQPQFQAKMTERKHFRPKYHPLPFVPPGSSSTFSLPATMQTLISNLKTQHNKLCFATQVASSVKMILKSSDDYLKDLVGTLQSSARYLNMECIRLMRENDGNLTKHSSLKRVFTQLDYLAKLTKQIGELQNKIVLLKNELGIGSVMKPPVDLADHHEKSMEKLEKQTFTKPKVAQQTRKPNKSVNRHPFHYQTSKKPVEKSESNVKVTHSNAETLRYVKILQVALRKNGYKLKMSED